MNNQDDVFENAVPTQEDIALEAKLREAEQEIIEFEQQGWTWQGEDPIMRRLCHPDDSEMYICFDPFTREQLLSRKLFERLLQDIQREREMRKDT